MRPFRKYPVLEWLLSPFRKSQQKTLGDVVEAIAEVQQARTRSIAAYLARKDDIRADSAQNRLYRLLRNPRIQDARLTQRMLALLGRGRTLLVAIDWTKWHDNLQMLLASVVLHKRAIPVQVHVTPDRDLWQNQEESAFLGRLCQALRRVRQPVVFLCDRGFHRVEWIKELTATRRGFLVRLCGKLTVHREGYEPTLLRNIPLEPGCFRDLGQVELRQDKAVWVRVVGVWGRNQKEPWWLATNLQQRSPQDLASLYGKRFDIEEQIRDVKGARFGVGLEWTQYTIPERLARLALLVGVALLLWTFAGIAKAKRCRWAQHRSRKKGPRVSLVEVGKHFLQEFLGLLTVEWIQDLWMPPKLRRYADLKPMENPQ